jgi:YesN/AraC family two-component response regulator
MDAYNRCIKRVSEKNGYDLIISDFRMPKMSGLELLRKVRQNSILEETKFILISGFGEEHIIKEAIGLKVTDFIAKPFRQEILLDKVKVALRHSHRKQRRKS